MLTVNESIFKTNFDKKESDLLWRIIQNSMKSNLKIVKNVERLTKNRLAVELTAAFFIFGQPGSGNLACDR